nr:hypothetical protein [Natrinema sp. DC36]
MDGTAEPTADIDAVETVADLIGETPLLRLESVADNCFGKLEAANPYSVKDRIARAILDAAERAGALEQGLAYERKLAYEVDDTHDYREGFEVRLEDREPEFRGE